MNQKHIAGILIIIGVLLSITVFMIKEKEDVVVEKFIEDKGSCYLNDGTCLHEDRSFTFYIVGWAISGILVIIGIYFFIMAKTQEILSSQTELVSENLAKAKKLEKEKDEFKAFLSGFSSDEKKILKVVKEQEGIKQSTLRFKTGMSKTTLSLILKSLEERDIISRKTAGKTKQIYLRSKF